MQLGRSKDFYKGAGPHIVAVVLRLCRIRMDIFLLTPEPVVLLCGLNTFTYMPLPPEHPDKTEALKTALEICALTHTLILDEDGLYDPAHFNDRLLLCLKGTMSEAELHILKARLVVGVLSKAQRAELKMPL